MKKVLVGYVSDCSTSGIDKYIINYIDSVKNDDIAFDFLTRGDSDFAKKELNKRGYNLYKVSRNRHFIRQIIEMKKIIKSNKYDAAYFNISESFNCVGIIAAKLFGIKKVIVHSHSSSIEKNNIIINLICRIINYLFKPIISICSDLNLACSDKAAKWLFSRNVYDNYDYEIIYNSIDYEKFKPNMNIRRKIREKYKIDDKFVVGHIGRFSYQKNHKFLLDIFNEYLKKNPESVLICVGDGPDYNKILDYSKKLGIYDKIIFTGAIDNVNEMIQSFDCFLLPSRFEGLPIVALEAQFSQVKCIISDKVSKMSLISDDSIMLPINDPRIWAKNISSKKTKLNKNAENYKLDKNKAQFNKIMNNFSGKYNIPSLLFKLLLVVHYILNLTVFYNGFNYLMVLCGLLLPIIFISKKFEYFRTKSKDIKIYLLFFAFLVSYIISFLLMKKYDITGSTKVFIWTALHMFFIFNTSYIKSINDLKKESYTAFDLLILILSVFNIHNLYLLINHIQATVTDFGGKLHPMGLTKWGRFYGNFYDVNYTSIVSICAILMAVYMFIICKSKVKKLLLCVSVFLQLVYLYLGQSRTGLLAFAVVFALFILFNNVIKKFDIKKIAISCILFFILVFVLPTQSLKLYNYLSYGNNAEKNNSVKKVDSKNIKKSNDDINSNIVIDEEMDYTTEDELLLGRTDYESDYSNGRLSIWECGIEIFKNEKIFGIGFSNILKYSLEKMPDSYITVKKFEAFHNTYIDLLASQGIVGFVIALIIFIYFAIINIKMIKKLLIKEKDSSCTYLYIFLALMLISVLVSSLLISQIFYVNNCVTFLFWLIMGYIYSISKCYKKEN